MICGRLVLGTAQLGMKYGINNLNGRPQRAEVVEMVSEAWNGGIREFDTAQDYADSESVLGDAFSALGISEAVVTSKISSKTVDGGIQSLDAALARSLDRLKTSVLSLLLLHNESQIDLWEQGIGDWFQVQKRKGHVRKAGVSVYAPERALAALQIEGVDAVQVPANILDRRMDQAGVFEMAQAKGKEIYIRSVFLQGALLMKPSAVPDRIGFLKEPVRQVRDCAKELKLPVPSFCFHYAAQKWPQAKIIVGSETAEQVRSNVMLACDDVSLLPIASIDERIQCLLETAVNPPLWPKT
jgi:aryl-alcohol dehydrogenase-like predicted oxidoreductase